MFYIYFNKKFLEYFKYCPIFEYKLQSMKKLFFILILLVTTKTYSQNLNQKDTVNFFASRIGVELDEYIFDSLPMIFKISNIYDSLDVKFNLVTRSFTFDNFDCFYVGTEKMHFNNDSNIKLNQKYIYYRLNKNSDGKYDLLFMTIEN